MSPREFLTIAAFAVAAELCSPQYSHAQGDTRSGAISGVVIDAETRAPLIGAAVALLQSKRGSVTDTSGRFEIAAVPVGVHALRVTYIGYHTASMTDIVVRSPRVTKVEIALRPNSLRQAEVVVEAGFFESGRDVAINNLSLSAEEIRREAGTGGDLSRILMSFPSISKGNDTRNDLVVRGGSPIENAFFVDGIEIPNINHYPQFGASGGAIGILNIDAIRDVSFSAGGFPARYGERLSSVTDIALRDGSRESTDFQADLHFMGAGLQAEGPMPGVDGSWFLSARRSYLDFVLKTFSSEALSSMPAYGDVHAKASIDLGGAGQLHLLDIFSMDASSSTREDAVENGENSFGYLNSVQNTAGAVWKKIWGSEAYSSATLAHTYSLFDQGYASARSGEQLMTNASSEQEWKLRTVNTFRLNGALTLETGFDARLSRYNLDMLYGAGPDPLGNPAPRITLSGVYSSLRGGAFLQGRWRLLPELFIAPSARVDYDDFSRHTEISPRMSISWDALSVATVTVSGGLYRQNLPAVLTRRNGTNRSLRSPLAWHAVAGLSYLLAADTRILMEVYDKRYERLPMDPAQPSLCILDELALTMDYFLGHGDLIDAGVARSSGVEFSLQKRMVKDLYGTVSASFSRSRYRGLDGLWRDRSYDNRYTFAVMGGYAPGRDWELSIRWIYAGGAPYTPFDADASRAAQSGVFDRERINSLRLPDYHTLNIRADKRFFFSRTTLTVFVAVWNLYGRKNVPYYRWNEITGKTEAPNLWSNNPLPVFGVEYEF